MFQPHRLDNEGAHISEPGNTENRGNRCRQSSIDGTRKSTAFRLKRGSPIIEMKQYHPTWACPNIAEQINLAFGTSI
jgi:hypothetical protein